MILGKDKHDTAMSWKRQGMVSSFLVLEKTRELICCQLSCFGKDKRYMHAMSWKRQAFVEVLKKRYAVWKCRQVPGEDTAKQLVNTRR